MLSILAYVPHVVVLSLPRVLNLSSDNRKSWMRGIPTFLKRAAPGCTRILLAPRWRLVSCSGSSLHCKGDGTLPAASQERHQVAQQRPAQMSDSDCKRADMDGCLFVLLGNDFRSALDHIQLDTFHKHHDLESS